VFDEATYRAHRRMELADTMASRMGLPDHCVVCTSPIYGLTRSRLGLWNGEAGAICDDCYRKFGGPVDAPVVVG
jgi:hypothetical protein